MFALLVGLLINTGLFYAFSKIIPGFEVKDEVAAAKVAVIYGVLLAITMAVLSVPVSIVTVMLVGILVAIPFIGPMLAMVASLPLLLAWFALGFAVSTVMIKMTDQVLDDFKVDSWKTAAVASLALAASRVVIRGLIGY